MRFTFWGTRGSLAAPGPDTVRYGGNTTCIEVRGGNDECIILDAGTGIRPLGLQLARSMPVNCHIFISHTHWDHIQGLPFFVPLFVPGNTVAMYGPPDPVTMGGIESVLSRQMEYPHFPVRVAELKADIRYRTLADREHVEVGGCSVTSLLMNHPAVDYGMKVECGGRSLFFTGDHEPFFNIYDPGDEEYQRYQEVVDERYQGMIDFLTGVDVLISDAQYTEEEYPARRGWGHSSFSQALDLARRAGIGRVYLTHHETTRSDAELDRVMERLRKEWADTGVDVHLAREGETIEV
ncbi:MBL fold metallo-hydrolase [Pseudodesulfovibrio tunisiensis]|uniref:MBL fold metallo-hydrolase n=1 Tax=Pseudodesulfovibrio tunisiensis TaxID=463192 RepID=UPI001FB3B903|nr:MBL fold metallo-hydrolase [Pseudodesulfovibrio tunisiensis]